jgi:hypothetical protein
MSMPWESPPPRREPSPPVQPYQPPPQQYQPPPQQNYQQPPQQMQPDIPLVARNPQTGEAVRVDVGAELREAIRSAITQSVVEGREAMGVRANQSIARMIKSEVEEEVDDKILEEKFSGGATTQRTFLQNIVVDMGVTVMAVVTTISQPTFDVTDRAAWLIVGTSLIKTLVTTAMSWATRIEAK